MKYPLMILGSILMIIFSTSYFQVQEKTFSPEQHEVTVRLVLVDVSVTKDRKFVVDLTKEDFELYEDGKRVPINSCDLISFAERKSLPTETRAEKPLVPASQKNLVVIFDGINTLPRNLSRGTEKMISELTELIQTH